MVWTQKNAKLSLGMSKGSATKKMPASASDLQNEGCGWRSPRGKLCGKAEFSGSLASVKAELKRLVSWNFPEGTIKRFEKEWKRVLVDEKKKKKAHKIMWECLLNFDDWIYNTVAFVFGE